MDGQFSWTSGEIHPEVVVAVAAVAVAYASAWRARGERISRTMAASFTMGLVTVLVALNGPLHDLSDSYLFSAHMVQHLALTLVMPPLLLAGTPGWMLDALLRPALRSSLAGTVVRSALRPLPALALYTVALAVWHLPAPYNGALEAHAWHVLEHLILMSTAVLAWWPVLSSSTLAPALPYGAQILYLFVFGMPMTVVAAMITAAQEVLYGVYAAAPRVTALAPLDDQRLGGVIMWVPAGLVPLIAFTIVFFRWAGSEAEDARTS